jgi:hypothetical protein
VFYTYMERFAGSGKKRKDRKAAIKQAQRPVEVALEA